MKITAARFAIAEATAFILAPAPGAAKFIKRPYLQNLTTTSVTIMVHSDRENVKLKWGETPSLGTTWSFNEHDDWADGYFKVHDVDEETLFGSNDADFCEVTLSGLIPGTTYYYRFINEADGFGSPEEQTQVLEFNTPPDTPAKDTAVPKDDQKPDTKPPVEDVPAAEDEAGKGAGSSCAMGTATGHDPW